jgi:hypothetical protein
MEGACGIISPLEDPRRVSKRIRRNARKSLGAKRQFEIQAWAHKLCSETFSLLFVPQVHSFTDREYVMDRINTEQPIEMPPSDPQLLEEIRRLYQAGHSAGIYPCDFELYKQADGRVALIDFDKFGEWCPDGSVRLPWNVTWTIDEVTRYTSLMN